MSHPLFGPLTVPVVSTLPATAVPVDAFPASLCGPSPSRELRRSVERFGVIEPVVLAEDPEGDVVTGGGRYRLVDGNRRVMASRAAGAESVPAIVLGRMEHPEELTLALNALRRDNPVTEYNAVAAAAARGLSESDIARATGYPVGRVRARLRLAGLARELFGALADQRVTTAVAETAAKLPAHLQRRLVERLEETGALTAADVRELRQCEVRRSRADLPLEIFAPSESGHWTDSIVSRLEAALGEIPDEAAETPDGRSLAEAVREAIDLARRAARAAESRHAA